jgi:methionyl-tRNA formyltransferase
VIDNDHLIVGCGDNTALELMTVQPEAKKRMTARDYIHGYRPRNGELLG